MNEMSVKFENPTITQEQFKKLSQCSSMEEMMAVVDREDIQLTKEHLENVYGGLNVRDENGLPIEKWIDASKTLVN